MHIWPRIMFYWFVQIFKVIGATSYEKYDLCSYAISESLNFFKKYIKILYIALRHVPFQIHVTVQNGQLVLVNWLVK